MTSPVVGRLFGGLLERGLVGQPDGVPPGPGQAHPPVVPSTEVGLQRPAVLPQHGHRRTGIQRDHQAADRAGVCDRVDHAIRDHLVLSRLVVRLDQAYLLRPDAEGALLPHQPARDVRGEKVRGADEASHERRARALVHLRRRADLLDAAAVDDRDPVAHGQRLLLVVRHEDEGDADRGLDRLELDLHLLAQLQIERAEGFVQEQHPRTVHQRPGERHALPLTTRQLPGAPVTEARESHRGQGLLRAGLALVLAYTLDPQAVSHVVEHIEVGKQGVVLEDGVDVATEGSQPGDVLAAEEDPPGGGRVEAGDQAQHRGLAGAGWTEQGEELSVRDLQVDPVDGAHLAGARAERLAQAGQGDGGTGVCHVHLSSGGRPRGRAPWRAS
jgi:hypothetical protein